MSSSRAEGLIVHVDLAVWLYSHFVIHLLLIADWDDFFFVQSPP